MKTDMTSEQIRAALSEPFQVSSLGFKPQSVKGNRALAIPYIDARDVMDRLDDVFGVGGWEDEYTPLDGGSVMCRLTVSMPDGPPVTKADVGGESEQPDGGDRMKAAFSDALKRAAVKFGIGRYLYSLPAVWCDYDPQRKQFTQTPTLPAWAVPKGTGKATPPPANPSPAAGEVTRPTDAALRTLLTAKGWAWRDVLRSLNEHGGGAAYPDSALPKDIAPAELVRFCDWLARQPDRPPVTA